MSASRRPVSELPGDPADLELIYSHSHRVSPYDYEDTLERWMVSVRFFRDPLEECEDGCAEGCAGGCDDLVDDGTQVGYLRLWRLRDYTGADRWMVADSESGDLESIVSTVLDQGEYSAAFEEAIECPVGDLLILDRVHLAKQRRGFGLGPMLAAEAIRRLAGGSCAVAAEPGMAEWPDNRDEATDEYRAAAKQKIGALWESIGFCSFQDGVQLLDTSLQEPIDLLDRRRAELAQLSAAYQEHHRARPQAPGAGVRARPARACRPGCVGTRFGTRAAHRCNARSGAGMVRPPHRAQQPDRSGEGLRRLGVEPERATALGVAARATDLTDLRELAIQVKDLHFGLREAWAAALTFPGRLIDLEPLRRDPHLLGPLADVFVYGSNLTGRYQGRSHAVGGDCRHSRHLGRQTERMTLAELVGHEPFWEWNGPSCSFCRGWSGQRLTAAQHAHYATVLSSRSR
ncbi:hypothetical protein [Streptomyces filamentosus]|uniref:hypothetical protein n=1 Tax=Streptomyces filamentosus TaxID=67294 RepID=UPI00340C6F81